ncbi:TonB-dependent receptor [Spongiibacter sp. KMU-166]|uniref:TonB-dependent receptor n=1 Tax=Spongiibacter thalassae TaxID=2721624 RepID=A0ABX1GAQ5_9GAMM|nr:TonB-dependent receptor [Spongiibacter thalassae]NKI16250.1 TonB-dependent receptor [Spongiibacter thalassae]
MNQILRPIVLGVFLTGEGAAVLAASGRASDEHSSAASAENASGQVVRTANRRVLEEVLVTAQKREESLQDVPISITSFSNEFVQENSISDLGDLSLFVPNARIDTNGTLPQLSIRGFNAHPMNRAFEQPISMVIDGVTYGTSPYFQLPLYDIQRVEVLRGPQGTLFGKNSTAGAFNIVTRSGGDEFSANVNLQSGQRGHRSVELGAGGPLVEDELEVRVVASFDERDGALRNTTKAVTPLANERSGGNRREAWRIKLTAPDLLAGRMEFTYDHANVEMTGLGSELTLVNPDAEAIYRQYDPGFDGITDNYITSVDGDEFTSIVVDSFALNHSFDVGDWGVTLVAGYSKLEYQSVMDADFGPTPMLTLDNKDTHPQTTFELRTDSPDLDGLLGLGSMFGADLGNSRLTTGVFWQDREISDALGRVIIDPASTVALLGIDAGSSSAPLPGAPAMPGGSGIQNDPSDDEIVDIVFSQMTESLAFFGQLDWMFNSVTTLQLGLRYGQESKSANWESAYSQGTGALALAALGREEYAAQREREESSLIPKILFKFDISDESNVYVSWVKGFRGGGFNMFASTSADSNLEYEEEVVASWEAGAKLRLFDGAANLNIAVFRMVLDDFQVLTQDPDTAAFAVDNSGRALSQGVELDGVWLLTDWVKLQGSVGYNPTEFLEFPYGGCTKDYPDTDGDGDERCDLTGEPLDFASEWSATLGPQFNINVLGEFELVAGITGIYQSEYYADLAVRDDRVLQGESLRWNANIGLGSRDGAWTVRLVGQNLTDEVVSMFISDVPLLTGTFYQAPAAPRSIHGEVTWRY